jgi:hypothetical protein
LHHRHLTSLWRLGCNFGGCSGFSRLMISWPVLADWPRLCHVTNGGFSIEMWRPTSLVVVSLVRGSSYGSLLGAVAATTSAFVFTFRRIRELWSRLKRHIFWRSVCPHPDALFVKRYSSSVIRQALFVKHCASNGFDEQSPVCSGIKGGEKRLKRLGLCEGA